MIFRKDSMTTTMDLNLRHESAYLLVQVCVSIEHSVMGYREHY